MNTEAEIRTAENPEFAEGLGLLDRIVAESKVAVSESERSSAKDQIAELVDEVLAGSVTVSNDLVTSLDVRIAQLDHLLSVELFSRLLMLQFVYGEDITQFQLADILLFIDLNQFHVQRIFLFQQTDNGSRVINLLVIRNQFVDQSILECQVVTIVEHFECLAIA